MKKQLFLLLIILSTTTHLHAATFTWLGTTSSDFNTASNWSGGGGTIPDSADHILISSSATNNLVLDQNRKISNLTLSSKTIDLNGYSLTVYGTATMTSGTVTNGTFYARGNLAAFNGTLMDCPVDADCGYIRFSGSTFNSTVTATDQGVATGTGAGGCTFNDDVTIIHGGNGTYFTLANTTGDVFNADLTVINYSSHEVHLSNTSITQYKGNLMLSSTGTGGITFGNSGGTSTLDSGKTITIGSTGFTNDVLLLKNFTQLGNTAQTLTLTGTAVASFNGSTFNGEITVSSPGILLKNSTFNGMSSFTKTGTSNAQSDGGNVFNGATTISNTGASGRIRMATVSGDTYNADVTFNSTGQDVQIAYSGDNTFAGNITINSNKVVFNTSTGKVTFTGTNNQTLNGSYNYPFKKMAINKSSGTVTANTTLSVDDSLIFIQGNLITTSANLLTMKHGSTAAGGSNSSFVSGPVKKVGNTAFVFDVGSGSTYRPLTITAPSNTTDAFTAEYYSAEQTLGNTKDTTITIVSDCGYWKLDRNVGSSNITPKFAFDSLHCDYLTVKPVHIALWNGTKWTDKGEAVTESTNKTTSTSMSSYGYFAFAYDLKPGDAPQMPYPLTTGSTCNSVELEFTTNDMWFSFTPDSAVVKAIFTSPDSIKTYASIKTAQIYSAYQPSDTLELIEAKTWPFDSLLSEYQNGLFELSTGVDYLMKISKFDSLDGSGIYNSISYYLNICLVNLKMSLTPTTKRYSSVSQLVTYLGTVENPMGNATSGDIILPASGYNGIIDITSIGGPLVIETGVTLAGTYDLLSQPYNIGGNPIATTPNGTKFVSTLRGKVVNGVLAAQGYMFFLSPGGEIRNVRLQGAMPGYQDYNQDNWLCAGTKILNNVSNGPFSIKHCEIYNFSYGGIFTNDNTDNVTIDNCYIHHIKGGGGYTTAKGYGIWIRGRNRNNVEGYNYFIKNCIFDESKEAIDTSPNPTNTTIDSCSFGQIFFNENINKHSFGGQSCTTCTYLHPGSNLIWNPPSNCYYYDSHDKDYVCSQTQESLASEFSITGNAAGNTYIENSIFHQDAKNIALEYPVNPYMLIPAWTPDNNPSPVEYRNPLYNIRLKQNTFAAKQDGPGDYADVCGLGGYARIQDINIEACTWEYERFHTINGTPAGTVGAPILIHTPNAFSYSPGNAVSSNSSPQPPEVAVTFDAATTTPGFSPYHPRVAYYNQGDPIEVTLSHGSLGSQNVTYIARTKVSEGALLGSNNSGNNAYNANQFTTEPSTNNAVLDNTDFGWDTNKPGLFGIDAYAVDGNYSATAGSPYYTSQMVHKPVIIVPDDDHLLIFNIKDSYYSDLYADPTLTGVMKRVELNGTVIWQEDIAEGGDDWERIEINLASSNFLGELDFNSFKNQLTFSIAIPTPGSVLTGGNYGNIVKGVNVWVDDVYLKKVGEPDNLIRDGSVENSIASELPFTPTPDCSWYVSDSTSFYAYHIDDTNVGGTYKNSNRAISRAFLNGIDRKSGLKSILLNLPALNFLGAHSQSYYLPLVPNSNQHMISVAVDFDTRDFVDCAFYTAAPLSYDDIPVTSGTFTNKNLLLNTSFQLIGNLTLTNSKILFEPSQTPHTITVPTGKTLTLIGNNAAQLTFLGGCKNMWGGIIVEPGGTLIIDGHVAGNGNHLVIVEDSYLAVSALGDGVTTSVEPVINLEGVKFNKNLISIQFQNDNFNASKVKGCYFSCDGGYITKDPAISYLFPDAHVYLVDATYTDSNPMLTSVGSKICIFENSYLGISATRSDVFSGNCEFRNLMKNANPLLKGIGIRASNNSSTERNLDVSSRFSNLSRGIFSVGNFNINIHDLDYFRDMDVAAVSSFHANYNNDIEINNVGNFERSNIGIYLSGSNFGTVNISNNTFTNSDFVETSTGSFHNTAITCQSPVASTAANFIISNNTIVDYRIGIHSRNISGIRIGSPNADISTTGETGNRITFNSMSENLENRGIWVQNCMDAQLNDNVIYNVDLYTSAGFSAIEIADVVDGRLRRNVMAGVGTISGIGLLIRNSCLGTVLECNSFSGFKSGSHLVNGNLPQQGVSDPIDPFGGEGWLNQWSSNIDPDYRVVGNTNNGNPIPWYHTGSGTSDFSPAQSITQVVSPKPNQTNDIDCDNPPLRIMDRDFELGPIVADTISYSEYADASRYIDRKKSFDLIARDTSVLTTGRSIDSSFVTFYGELQNSNVYLLRLPQNMDGLDIDSLYTLNENINDTIDVETNKKLINSIHLYALATSANYSAADTAALTEISVQPSSALGSSVYESWAMLFKEVHEPIPELRLMGTSNGNINLGQLNSQSSFSIFPNPVNTHLNLVPSEKRKIVVIEIYDIVGKLVWKQSNPETIINIQWLEEGTYIVRVYDSSEHHYQRKFVKIK